MDTTGTTMEAVNVLKGTTDSALRIHDQHPSNE